MPEKTQTITMHRDHRITVDGHPWGTWWPVGAAKGMRCAGCGDAICEGTLRELKITFAWHMENRHTAVAAETGETS